MGRDFLLRAPLVLAILTTTRGWRGGGRPAAVVSQPDVAPGWPRTAEKTRPPRWSGLFTAAAAAAALRPGSPPGSLRLPTSRKPEGCVRLSCSASSACAASGLRDLARRGGLGWRPACGTGSLCPNAPARRVEWVPVVGAEEVLSPGGDRGQDTGHCSVLCPHVARLCVSLVCTPFLWGRYLVHILGCSVFFVQNLPLNYFFLVMELKRVLEK